MRAASDHGLRPLEEPREDAAPRARRDTTRFVLVTFVVLAIATVLFGVISSLTSARRAVRALPDEERRELLSRTVDELRQYCGPGRPEGLAGHCRELASFAAEFEECQGECEALVRRELTPAPTR